MRWAFDVRLVVFLEEILGKNINSGTVVDYYTPTRHEFVPTLRRLDGRCCNADLCCVPTSVVVDIDEGHARRNLPHCNSLIRSNVTLLV